MVKRPTLKLGLVGTKGDNIEALGVIDSGADTTTLNIQYADFLGVTLDKSAPKDIMGIGDNKVQTYPGKFRFTLKDMGIDMEVPAWYVDSKHVNILLGQEVFFDSFRIKFEKDHDTFEVIPSSK